MKFSAIVGCLLFAACVVAQNAGDSEMYLQFFQAAAHRPEVAPGQPLSINGEGLPVTYTQPTMEDTLGITSDEAHSIVQISLQCESGINKLDATMSQLIFESRLELADSGKGFRSCCRKTERTRNETNTDHSGSRSADEDFTRRSIQNR